MKSTILLGVTGGIGAVKIPELLRAFLPAYNIDVIQTPSATHIIAPKEIENLTGNPVYTHLFDKNFEKEKILKNRSVEHVNLADRADVFVIVPATANTIAKLAAGMADDYLTTTALAVTCPVIICPSMNVHMWKNKATQKNIQILRTLGYHILGPDSGMLACGYEGEGRLIDIGQLVQVITSFTSLTKPLTAKKILITAGGTIEPIDDVRFISNKSSGKMGVALAEAATLAGAKVLLLRSVTSVSPRLAVEEILFDTADSLEKLMKTYCPQFDICIHAAAVSDFSLTKKQGKSSSEIPLALELEPRKKILSSIKTYNPNIFLVAFKAEANVSDSELIALSIKRLTKAKANLIVANDIGRSGIGFQSDDNDVFVIDANGQSTHLTKTHKSIIAEQIIRILAKMLYT